MHGLFLKLQMLFIALNLPCLQEKRKVSEHVQHCTYKQETFSPDIMRKLCCEYTNHHFTRACKASFILVYDEESMKRVFIYGVLTTTNYVIRCVTAKNLWIYREASIPRWATILKTCIHSSLCEYVTELKSALFNNLRIFHLQIRHIQVKKQTRFIITQKMEKIF